MNQVVFRRLTGEGKIQRLGTARMVDGKVTIEFKNPRIQKNLELEKVFNGVEGRYFTPADGVDYFLTLPVEFYGSRLWAEVEEV